MATIEDIRWFKQQFSDAIRAATVGTPFTVDMLTALACQETGELWSAFRKAGLPVADILALCVGDTLDEDKGRRAFPRTKAALMAANEGAAMFDIARAGLVDMARHVPAYAAVANRPDKFCHGFGIFQYDLQFFEKDPAYFLTRRYADFSASLGKALEELRAKARKIGLGDRPALSDREMAHVAIAYNTGKFDPARGLKQGHKSGGKFYGENYFALLLKSKTVVIEAAAPNPVDGRAVLPPPSPVTASGVAMRVDTREGRLMLRRAAAKTAPIDARLPDGHPVHALTGQPANGFLEVETSLDGALLRGFAAAQFLVRDPSAAVIPVVEPAPTRAVPPLPEAHLPRRPGSITRRSDIANASSLNEAGQPRRTGSTAAELRMSLDAVIDWLAVEKVSHKRYAPRASLTFCNIYAHDYCTLAGVYLPRCWWSQQALVKLSRGEAVEPLIGATIFEMRANNLFHWLRDFGPMFGWRRTGTLTKLQQAANAGGIGLIVALREDEGRPGHIVTIAPEGAVAAVRDSVNEVIQSVESQAGVRNFRRGHNGRNWWRDRKFADAAFWIHD